MITNKIYKVINSIVINMSNNLDNADPSLFILNVNNKKITSEYIEGVLKKYSCDFKVDPKMIKYYQTAMTHTSYVLKEDYTQKMSKKAPTIELKPIQNPEKAIPIQDEAYERLEFLGDAVLHEILARYIFKRYENEMEGFMTKLRTKIENSESFAHLAKVIGLNEYVLVSQYIELTGGRENNESLLEDAFEAFIGALSLDSADKDPTLCRRFITNLIEEEIDFSQLLYVETNFKDILLQYFHKMRYQDPTYGTLDISGPDHKKMYTMYVKWRKDPSDDGEIVGMGVGSSKKKGEQEAARQALIHYGEIKADDEDDSEEECIELDD